MSAESHSTIYPPPREGLPYLVVTFTDGEMISSVPVETRDRARAMLAAQNTKSAQASLHAVS